MIYENKEINKAKFLNIAITFRNLWQSNGEKKREYRDTQKKLSNYISNYIMD